MPDTTRLGLRRPVGADTFALSTDLQDVVDTLDNAALYAKGTLAAIPAANSVPDGTIYRATDTGVFYESTGAAWLVVGKRPNGDIAGAELADGSLGWGKTALDGDGFLAEACSVANLGAQSVGAGVTAWANFGQVLFDPSGVVDLANDKYIPQTKGVYAVHAAAFGNVSGGTDLRLHLSIYKNGGSARGSGGAEPLDRSGYSRIGQSISGLIAMNGTTDYLQLEIRHSGTAVVSYPNQNIVFDAHLIGRQA